MSKNPLKTQETHFDETVRRFESCHPDEKNNEISPERGFLSLIEKTVHKTVPLYPNHRKRFLKDKTPYKLPTIIRSKTGDWMVRYKFEIPGKPGIFKTFNVRDGINYIHDPEKKEAAIIQLRADIEYALTKKDFNPFKPALSGDAQIAVEKQKRAKGRAFTLPAALSWYVEVKGKMGKGDRTIGNYKICVQGLINYFAPKIPRIDEITIDDIEQYLAGRLENDWGARSYNNHIGDLTTFFNYLVSKRKLAINPIGKGMLERIPNKAEKNKYYDQETLEKLLPEFQKVPVLRKFVLWTYYSCARGTELRALQIKHLDLNIKKISIMAETGKTGEHVGKRSIPLCQELMDIIVEDKLKDLPGDWFVFGNEGEPGPIATYENYFSKRYHPIKVALNIDFKYTIYGIKHTRVIDLLMSGMEPIKVMLYTGHTDWGSFQAYIRELGAVMDKQLIGNTLKLKI
jgi:integrase